MDPGFLGTAMKSSWAPVEFARKLAVRVPLNSLGVRCTGCPAPQLNTIGAIRNKILGIGREAPYASILLAPITDKG